MMPGVWRLRTSVCAPLALPFPSRFPIDAPSLRFHAPRSAVFAAARTVHSPNRRPADD
jgi:hypothetical protein